MRRAPALFVVVGVVAGLAGQPLQAQQTQTTSGFWVSLAAGAAGNSNPPDYSEFWFESPHAPPISVTQATGAGTVQAMTGGGSTFFTAAGTPILVPTTDGYATLSPSGSSFPSAALPRFAGGTQASGAPQGGGTMPTNADKLSLSLSSPGTNGSQVLSVSVTSPTGTTLGQTNIPVPTNDWWVVGLGPGSQTITTTPGGGTTPILVPTAPTPPTPPSGSDPGGNGGGGNNCGPAMAPEPASVVLLGLGGITAAGWRFRRRISFRPSVFSE
jgi:hypothetical protein